MKLISGALLLQIIRRNTCSKHSLASDTGGVRDFSRWTVTVIKRFCFHYKVFGGIFTYQECGIQNISFLLHFHFFSFVFTNYVLDFSTQTKRIFMRQNQLLERISHFFCYWCQSLCINITKHRIWGVIWVFLLEFCFISHKLFMLASFGFYQNTPTKIPPRTDQHTLTSRANQKCWNGIVPFELWRIVWWEQFRTDPQVIFRSWEL